MAALSLLLSVLLMRPAMPSNPTATITSEISTSSRLKPDTCTGAYRFAQRGESSMLILRSLRAAQYTAANVLAECCRGLRDTTCQHVKCTRVVHTAAVAQREGDLSRQIGHAVGKIGDAVAAAVGQGVAAVQGGIGADHGVSARRRRDVLHRPAGTPTARADGRAGHAIAAAANQYVAAGLDSLAARQRHRGYQSVNLGNIAIALDGGAEIGHGNSGENRYHCNQHQKLDEREALVPRHFLNRPGFS